MKLKVLDGDMGGGIGISEDVFGRKSIEELAEQPEEKAVLFADMCQTLCNCWQC